MKILINKTDKNILPITKIYDLGSVTTTIDDLLNESTITLEKNITPILSIDGSNYLINNFNSTNIKEDFEAIITESDLISLGGGDDYLKKDIATYPIATTPLDPSDKAIVFQGGVPREVAVSELGGGGASAIESYIQALTAVAVATDSAWRTFNKGGLNTNGLNGAFYGNSGVPNIDETRRGQQLGIKSKKLLKRIKINILQRSTGFEFAIQKADIDINGLPILGTMRNIQQVTLPTAGFQIDAYLDWEITNNDANGEFGSIYYLLIRNTGSETQGMVFFNLWEFE